MNTKLSTSRTAPTRSLKKQKRSNAGLVQHAKEEARFWKNVALSLAISIVSLLFSLLLALLLK